MPAALRLSAQHQTVMKGPDGVTKAAQVVQSLHVVHVSQRKHCSHAGCQACGLLALSLMTCQYAGTLLQKLPQALGLMHEHA